MSRKSLRAVIAAAIPALMIGAAKAQTFTWNNAAGGLFSQASNWTPVGPPSPTQLAYFNLPNTYVVSFNSSPSVGGLLLGQGTVTLLGSTAQSLTTGTMQLNGGTLNVTSNMTLVNVGPSTINTGANLVVTTGAYNTTSEVFVNGGRFSTPVFSQSGTHGLYIQNGGTLSLLSSNAVNNGRAVIIQTGGHLECSSYVDVGSGSWGMVTVDGLGSTYSVAGTSDVGASGTGTISLSSSAAGTFGALRLAESSNPSSMGVLSLASSSATITANLNVGTSQGSAWVPISGNSSLTMTTSRITIGSTGAGAATGTMQLDGGTITSSSQGIAVQQRGRLVLNTGTINLNGNLSVDGGVVSQGASGNINIAPGFGITIKSSGVGTFGGNFVLGANNTFNAMSGAMVSFDTGSAFVGGSSGAATFNISGGATVTGSNFYCGAHGAGNGFLQFLDGQLNVHTFQLGYALGGIGVATMGSSSGTLTTDYFNMYKPGSVFTLGLGYLNVNNSLTIANGAVFNQTGGALVKAQNASVDVTATAYAAIASDLVFNSGGRLSVAAGGTLDTSGSLILDGVGHLIDGSVNSTNGSFAVGAYAYADLTITGLLKQDAPHDGGMVIGGYGITGTVRVIGGGIATTKTTALVGTEGGTGTLSLDGGYFTSEQPLYIGQNGVGSLLVLNSTLTASELRVADSDSATIPASIPLKGFVKSSGAFSSITIGTLSIGTLATAGSVELSDGTLTGSVLKLNNGTLIIDGAHVQLDTIATAGTRIQFTSGYFATNALELGQYWALGPSVTLDSQKTLEINGGLTINPNTNLTIDGGTLAVESLVNLGGSFELRKGTLRYDSAFGNDIVAVNGSFTIPDYSTVESVNTGTVQTGGSLEISPRGQMHALARFANRGSVVMDGALALLDTGTFDNYGSLRGSGRIRGVVTNYSTGNIRVNDGDTLEIESVGSTSFTNAGKVALNGGTIRLPEGSINSLPGKIDGRGTIIAAGSLSNSGTMAFSAGISDVYGQIFNNSGAKTIISGQGNVSFWSNITCSGGSEFRVSTGATATFFGTVTGTANFTGSGLKIFESTATPGPIVTSGSSIIEDGGNVSVPYIRESALTVYGNMTIQPNGTTTGTSRLNSLTIDGGTLDLNDNDLVIDYTSSSPITDIRGYLAASSLFSSTANASTNPKFSIGYMENTTGLTTFSGQNVDNTSLLVAYTLSGDSNLDGKVNTIDFNNLAGAFGQSSQFWVNGDFNYDSTVNSLDFSQFIANYGNNTVVGAAPTLGAVVPEPSLISLLVAAQILRRRRR